MVKLDSLQSAQDHIKKIIADGENGISTHIISGRASGGKRRLMDIGQNFAAENGYVIFRFPGNIVQESVPYQPFNHVLNSMYDTTEERGMNEIIKKFSEYFSENAGIKILIIIEGLERMNTSSQDLFLYLSRMVGKFGVSLMGTYSKHPSAIGPDSEFNFIIVSSTEPQVHIINVRDTNFDDARFYVETSGYKLPENFVMDLFRLSSGDLNTINYALKYYSDIGIINERKEVNEAVFRFLPIPPAIEDYYSKKIADLSETELKVAGTLAMSGEDLDIDVISRVTSFSKSDLYKVLASLDHSGIISVNDFKYQISSRRLAGIIRTKVSSVWKLDIADQIINSPSFDDLSLQTKLNMLKERGMYSNVGDMIRKNWKATLNSFVSPDDLISFLDSVQDKLDEEAKRYALLIKCNSLFFLGRFDRCVKCFSENNFRDIAGREPELRMASALESMGKNDEASSLIEGVLSDKGLSPEERVIGLSAKAALLIRIRKSSEALLIANEAMEIAKNYSVEDEMDEILTVMATANADVFKLDNARKLYSEAIEIEKKRGNIRRINRNLHDLAIIESFEGNFQKGIDMLKELLESTYINGDIGIRSYALYNLMDMLHIIGDTQGSLAYKDTTERLLEIIQDNDIKFIYYRYMALFHIESLKFNEGISYAQRAIELSEKSGNDDWKSAARGIYHILQVNSGNTREIDPTLFHANFSSLEDYIPIYLGFWSNIFAFRGVEDKALEALTASEKYSNEMGDVSSKLNTEVNKMVFNLSFDKFDNLVPSTSYVGDSEVRKYDYSMKAIEAAKKLKDGETQIFLDESRKIIDELWDDSGFYNSVIYPVFLLGIARKKFLDDNRVVKMISEIFTGSDPKTKMAEIAKIIKGE